MSGGSSYPSPKAVSAFNVMFSYMSNRLGRIIARAGSSRNSQVLLSCLPYRS
jgi:hypothetical protein